MRKIKKNTALTTVLLDTRVSRKDNTFPVRLRITHKRMQFYYPIKYEVKQSGQQISKHQEFWLKRFKSTISFTPEEFALVTNPKCKEPYRTMFVFLNEIESIARSAINDLPVFTFNLFKERFYNKPADESDLIEGLSLREKTLRAEGRISTAKTFKCTIASLKQHLGTDKISYEDISVHVLSNYEKWMVSKKKSLTTVGIYMRNIRTIYNQARKTGVVQFELYPFGEGKYEIPSGKNIKKALTFEDVKKIANYTPIFGSSEHRFRDYWLFSYLGNGINIKDLARLTYGKIEGDIIKLTRAKTEREKRHNPRPITIVLTKPLKDIIGQWGNKPTWPEEYIFPILYQGITPEQEYANIQQATKMINKYIGRICEQLEITQKVTSYTARHSYASVLKRSGASVEFISESLGHSNTITTENYLADFEIEEKRKWAEKAADFSSIG